MADKLGTVPAAARAEVDRNLALLNTQISEANQRLAAEGRKGEGFVRNAILGPLTSKRVATIDRIAIAIDRVADRPQGLNRLAQCALRTGRGSNNGSNGGNGNNNGVNTVAVGGRDGNNNGQNVLGRDCSRSRLPRHDGFQNSPACVNTQMGEVSDAAQNPSLLIVGAPRVVRVGQGFRLRVSTRNLVRDRFLGAAAGGYYLESSFLNRQGLQRGHFHTACRMLRSTRVAPDAAPAPAFFKATEDGRGGSRPDTVTVEVTGMPRRGLAQCAVWAGDGSHRPPMMERANQTPAIDVVRIWVW